MLPLRRAENHLAAVDVVWSHGCATALELGQLSLLWGLENQQTLLGRETAFCRVPWSQYLAGTTRLGDSPELGREEAGQDGAA